MEHSSLNSTMKRDILNAYNKSMQRMKAKGCPATIEQIIQDAFLSGAPRFYISPRYAANNVMRVINGKPLPPTLRQVNKDKFLELARLYIAAVEEDGDTRHPIFIFSDLVERPAPSFYLTYKTFRRLVYQSLGDPAIRSLKTL